jgi:hypothetical protein
VALGQQGCHREPNRFLFAYNDSFHIFDQPLGNRGHLRWGKRLGLLDGRDAEFLALRRFEIVGNDQLHEFKSLLLPGAYSVLDTCWMLSSRQVWLICRVNVNNSGHRPGKRQLNTFSGAG